MPTIKERAEKAFPLPQKDCTHNHPTQVAVTGILREGYERGFTDAMQQRTEVTEIREIPEHLRWTLKDTIEYQNDLIHGKSSANAITEGAVREANRALVSTEGSMGEKMRAALEAYERMRSEEGS